MTLEQLNNLQADTDAQIVLAKANAVRVVTSAKVQADRFTTQATNLTTTSANIGDAITALNNPPV